jgi:hypothetical protein
MRAVDEFDESEPARAAGLPIDRQHDLRWRRHGAEVGAQVGFCSAVGKITDEQTDGQSTLSYVMEQGREARDGGRTHASSRFLSEKPYPNSGHPASGGYGKA